jgi:hypothetical protein
MILIPIATEGHRNDALIVIINKSNVERMKRADPAEIKLKELTGNLVSPVIMIAYEDSSPQLAKLIQSGDIKGIVKFLQRGWAFKPDKGDNDRGPESIKNLN